MRNRVVTFKIILKNPDKVQSLSIELGPILFFLLCPLEETSQTRQNFMDIA